MSTLTKVFTVLVLVMSLIYLGVTATLFAHRGDWMFKFKREEALFEKARGEWKNKEDNFVSKLSDRDKEKASVDQKVADIEVARKDLDAKYSEAVDARDESLAAVQRLSDENKSLAGTIEDQKRSIETLTRQLREADALRDDAMKVRDTVQAELIALKDLYDKRMKDLAQLDESYVSQAKELQDVKLLFEQVRKAYGLDIEKLRLPKPAINGRVLAVSDKVNLVLISVGRKDGVEVGYDFTVYRGGDYIATIIVEKVEEDWSAARLKENTLKDPRKPVQVNDNVATRIYD